VGLALFCEFPRLHSDTPQSVELLWTRDQPEADFYLTTHNTDKRQTSMPLGGIQTRIPSNERPEAHALDRPTTEIDSVRLNSQIPTDDVEDWDY